jgi:hypothetical protein
MKKMLLKCLLQNLTTINFHRITVNDNTRYGCIFWGERKNINGR